MSKEETSIERDTLLMNCVSSDASAMLDFFVAQLQPLEAVVRTRGKSLSRFLTLSVLGLNEGFSKLGVSDGCARLSLVAPPQESDFLPLTRQADCAIHGGRTAALLNPCVELNPMERPTSMEDVDDVIPKFTWASHARSRAKKTSLLDIQSEERQAKALLPN